MKLKLITLLLTMFFLGSGIAFSQKKKDNKTETVTFDVSMTCGNCQKKIERNIAYEKGVSDLMVNLDAKTVMVKFKKDKTTVEKLQTAIEKLGYEVNIHNEKEKEKEE